jgi:hypothetical protein
VQPEALFVVRLLYLVAEDATIEDTLYYLEKSMISGELNVETFLKVIVTSITA